MLKPVYMYYFLIDFDNFRALFSIQYEDLF